MPHQKRRRSASTSSEDSSTDDSDRELRDAFASGALKPGLNRVIETTAKTYPNNVVDMKSKLAEMRVDLPWIETLDTTVEPAPLAPEVALQIERTAQRKANVINSSKHSKPDVGEAPVLNEFKRESLFHRQAQASVMESIMRLHSLGVVTKRPDIYFAEMAKTDVHMQKVRKNLMAKEAGQAKAEKIRQLRQQKKMGKQLQAETKQRRASEKRAILDEVKKYKKGIQRNEDDFLTDKQKKKSDAKKKLKNDKFGFGGKKRGNKINTRESSNDFSNLHRKGNKSKIIKKNVGMKKNKRPGKSRRANTKSKRK